MKLLSLMMIAVLSQPVLAGEITREESSAILAAAGITTSLGAVMLNESQQTYGVAVSDERLTRQLLAVDKKISDLRNPQNTSSKALQRALMDEAIETRNIIIREADEAGKIMLVHLDAVQSNAGALKVHRDLQAKKNRYLLHLAEEEGDTKAISKIRYNTRMGVGVSQARAGLRLIKGGAAMLVVGGALTYATDVSLGDKTVPSQVSADTPVPTILKASN